MEHSKKISSVSKFSSATVGYRCTVYFTLGLHARPWLECISVRWRLSDLLTNYTANNSVHCRYFVLKLESLCTIIFLIDA